jgi:hypothetical protein
LKEPLLHFALLGALIFAAEAWRSRRPSKENDPPSIEISAGTIAWLRDGFTRQWQRAPDVDELRGLVAAHIREEVLYREALAMGLDRDDTIVRRRMAQKMEFLTADIVSAAEPDDEVLKRSMADHAAQYASPGRISFRHVYFSKEKRGLGVDAAAGEALAALTRGVSDDTLGDPFLHGFEFAEQQQEDIVALFGSEFATQVAALREHEWAGPVKSSYGLHLVRIEGRGATQSPGFDSIRAIVLRDWKEERRQIANAELFEKLRARYRISVDDAALEKSARNTSTTALR